MRDGRTKLSRWFLVAVLLVGCEGCHGAARGPAARPGHRAHAQEPPADDPARGTDDSDPAGASDDSEPTRAGAAPTPLLARAELAALEAAGCHRLLREHDVAFEVVPADEAEGVSIPIRLAGPVAGVEVRHMGRSARHDTLDCRLAVSLLGWASALRAARIERLEHMSIYRPAARVRRTGEPSGHASGTAIDAAWFVREDGTTLEVERDWADKAPGAPPCPPRDDEPEPQRLLRTLVCDAVDADLFQVVVTPHGDRRHHNHVHLEIRPDVDWTHVR